MYLRYKRLSGQLHLTILCVYSRTNLNTKQIIRQYNHIHCIHIMFVSIILSFYYSLDPYFVRSCSSKHLLSYRAAETPCHGRLSKATEMNRSLTGNHIQRTTRIIFPFAVLPFPQSCYQPCYHLPSTNQILQSRCEVHSGAAQ